MSEEPEYLSIGDAAKLIGLNTVTLHDWIKTFEIEKHRFLRNNKRYITLEDAMRLKEIKEKPWLAGRKPGNQGEES